MWLCLLSPSLYLICWAVMDCQNSKCEAGNVNCNDGNYLNGSIIVLLQPDVGKGEIQASHINSNFPFYFLARFSPRYLKWNSINWPPQLSPLSFPFSFIMSADPILNTLYPKNRLILQNWSSSSYPCSSWYLRLWSSCFSWMICICVCVYPPIVCENAFPRVSLRYHASCKSTLVLI